MSRPSSKLTMFILTVVILFTRVAVGSVLRDAQGSDVVKMFVTEGDDVILPCSARPKENIEATVFDWIKDNKEVFLFDNGKHYGNGRSDQDQDQDFKGRVSHFVEELKHGNASILIRDTKTTDSGNFTCIFPHLKPRQTYTIELVVGMTFKNRLGQIEGAALPPYVKILNVTGDGVLLECLVRGAYPEPQVEWQTSDGSVVHAEKQQVSPRGHRFDVLLLTTVKKTNMYRCVVKQDGFGHVIDNELFVPDNLFEDKSSHCTSVPMVVIITLIVALVIEHLVAFLVKKIMNQRKKMLKRRSTGGDAVPDEAEELKSQLPDGDAVPDEAGRQLNNGS